MRCHENKIPMYRNDRNGKIPQVLPGIIASGVGKLLEFSLFYQWSLYVAILRYFQITAFSKRKKLWLIFYLWRSSSISSRAPSPLPLWVSRSPPYPSPPLPPQWRAYEAACWRKGVRDTRLKAPSGREVEAQGVKRRVEGERARGGLRDRGVARKYAAFVGRQVERGRPKGNVNAALSHMFPWRHTRVCNSQSRKTHARIVELRMDGQEFPAIVATSWKAGRLEGVKAGGWRTDTDRSV